MSVAIKRRRDAVRARVAGWKAAGASVGVVPTMGALHAGHLSLVEAARATCERVIVTLFVNPKQFNNAQDLAGYPRTERDDAAKLEPYSVDLLYVPDPEQIYPAGFATNVSVAGLSEVLCGAHRPGHFDGVATVVTKLLLQTGADRAFFGEKDWQQLLIVRRLVDDLDIATRIIGCPTVREADGLALSSRNALLSTQARAIAPALNRAMRAAVAALEGGAPVRPTLDAARARILSQGFSNVEYLELRAADDLAPLGAPARPARLLAAATVGGVRLIDNIAVTPRP